MADRAYLLGPLHGSGAGLWTSATQAAGITVSALFQQQVVCKRDAIALEGSGCALTYGELGERVSRLVRALAAKCLSR